MNEIKKNDLNFGLKSEQEIHSILEEQFGKLLRTEINPEMGKYYEFDKYNEDYFIEIKSRTIEKRGRCDRGKNEFTDCVDIKQKNIKPLKNLLDI